jgi:hypothetical protein
VRNDAASQRQGLVGERRRANPTLTGNKALAQYLALRVGCDLVPHVVTEQEALERKAALFDAMQAKEGVR